MSKLLRKARATRKGVQSAAASKLSSTREALHTRRVVVTHAVRGKRGDGRLGETELEARLAQAVRYDMYAAAGILTSKLEEVRSAKAALARAKGEGDFGAAEEADKVLAEATEREEMEEALRAVYGEWAALHPERAARVEAAERRREEKARRKKEKAKAKARKNGVDVVEEGGGEGSAGEGSAGEGSAGEEGEGMVKGIHAKLHSSRVKMVHRMRGKRKDGGLGKTELEAMAYQAEAKGRYEEAALLLSRCRALHDAKLAKKAAIVAEDFAEAQAQTQKIAELRVREPFMEQIAMLRAAEAKGGDGGEGASGAGGSGGGGGGGEDEGFVVAGEFETVDEKSPIVVTMLTSSQIAAAHSPYMDDGSSAGGGGGGETGLESPLPGPPRPKGPAPVEEGVEEGADTGGSEAFAFAFDSDSSYETLTMDL